MTFHDWIHRHHKLLMLLAAGALTSTGWLIRLTGGSMDTFHLLLTIAAIVAGAPIVKLAVGSLRAGQFSIALLVSIAAGGAILIGESWEAAAVTFLYLLGTYLEELTLARTRAALRELIDLAPRTARVQRGEATVIIPAEEVQVGERVLLLPGDRLAVDGKVVAGQAALDTAALTGEPLPAEVGPGDRVMGGSVSQGGYLEVEAERVGADTTFSRMIFMVAEAQERRPRVQRFLDRFSQWYTPAIIISSILLYLFTGDIHLALTFLVIGCPGALVVAAPVAVVAGLGRAAREGILIKGGERLERVGKVDTIAFDKTGTLTMGRPRVATVRPFEGTEADLLAWAAAAEQRSEHHLATAILAHAREQNVEAAPATDWRLEPGMGAVALSEDGSEILVGNRKLLHSRGVELTAEQEAAAQAREAEGESLALVTVGGRPVGLISITDPVRPEAAALIRRLRKVGIRHTVMLTGDHSAAAQRVARSLGLDEVRAGLAPAEKVVAIAELQAKGHRVAMVGDGVNDAPALAAADISIAMGGSGTQVAIETADITLMSDRLEKVDRAIGLSRKIMGVVRQNVVLAIAVVLLLLAGVLGRFLFLSAGMLIHEASVLLVILNGMRLLRVRPHQLLDGKEQRPASGVDQQLDATVAGQVD